MAIKIKNIIKKHNFLVILIIAIIFGLAGGIVGDLVARSYILETSYNLPFLSNIDFSKVDYRGQGIVINNARNVTIEQDTKIDEIINSTASSFVTIFKEQKVGKKGLEFDLNNYYKLDQPLGQGFVITSDGWIITSLQFEKKASLADFVVITNDKVIYNIDKILTDDLTSFNFIHVKARDLSVKKFAEHRSINSGSMIVAINWESISWLSSVIGLMEEDENQVMSSDHFSKNIILADILPKEFYGSILFNLAGEVVGFANSRGEIEIITHLEAAIKSLLKYKEIRRPSLGVNYLDLSRLVAAGGQELNLNNKGALIYKDAKGVALAKGGVAELAGLQAGDIITAINNIEIDGFNDLTYIIQNYTAGEKIKINYWRSDELKEVDIVLGEIK